MSLTRFLPTPSDRMGILWSLLPIDGCVVLEYGPAGTTHFSMSLFGELGESQQDRLFTTHMSEDDVVMGDVSRLEIEADTRSVDRARRSYCMKYTGQTYGYAGNYDLTVNTGSLGFDKAAELICSAAEMI